MTLASVGYRRGYDQIMKRADLNYVTKPSEAKDERQREYLEAVTTLVVSGATPQQMVRFRTTALRTWECRIADGTLEYLSEEEFVAEAEEALQQLVRSYRKQLTFIKDRIYDLGIPQVRRRLEEERGN